MTSRPSHPDRVPGLFDLVLISAQIDELRLWHAIVVDLKELIAIKGEGPTNEDASLVAVTGKTPTRVDGKAIAI